MKKSFLMTPELLVNDLLNIAANFTAWLFGKFKSNIALFSSIALHIAILAVLFVNISGKTHGLNAQFIPIGLEIADFKRGALIKKSGYKNKSDKMVAKKSENGEKLAKDNSSGQSEELQKSRISKYKSYVELIAHELEKRKSRFSMDNAPQDMKVTVVFEVNLDETGNLKSYKVVKKSGTKFFDNVAKRIITASKQFPNPPKEIQSMGLTFSIPIIFDSLA